MPSNLEINRNSPEINASLELARTNIQDTIHSNLVKDPNTLLTLLATYEIIDYVQNPDHKTIPPNVASSIFRTNYLEPNKAHQMFQLVSSFVNEGDINAAIVIIGSTSIENPTKQSINTALVAVNKGPKHIKVVETTQAA